MKIGHYTSEAAAGSHHSADFRSCVGNSSLRVDPRHELAGEEASCEPQCSAAHGFSVDSVRTPNPEAASLVGSADAQVFAKATGGYDYTIHRSKDTSYMCYVL